MVSIKHIFLITIICFCGYSVAMESLYHGERAEQEPIWVHTSDGSVIGIAKWKVRQMKALQVTLERQEGTNSYDNPVYATEVTRSELILLSDAFDVIKIGDFDSYFHNPALSVEESVDGLRVISNAAQKVDATGLLSLCASYILPKEVYPWIIQQLMFPVTSLLFAPEIKNLVSGNNSTFIRDISCNSSGTLIVSGGSGKGGNNLLVWDVAAGKQRYSLKGHPHPGMVETVSFSPDETKLVSGGSGNQNNLFVWDVATGNQLHNLVSHYSVVSAAFSPDGTKIVSGGFGDQNNLFVWDVATGNQLHNLVGHQDTVTSVAFSSDGTKIVSGGSGHQNNLFVWDVVTGNQLHNLVGHQNAVTSVAFSPDGTKIVSGGTGDQNNLFVWDVATGTQIHNLVGHFGVLSTAFSADGAKLASGGFGDQDNLFVWDVATGHQLHNLAGHQGNIYSVAFSPDGMRLVSGGEQPKNTSSLFVWDIVTGNQLYSMQQGRIMSVAWCSNLIVAGGDGSLVLWSFDPQGEVKNFLQSLTIAQARLLYELYCAKESGTTVTLRLGTIDYQEWNKLPQKIKQKCCNIFPVVIEGCGIEEQKIEEVEEQIEEAPRSGGCCIS